MSQQNRNLKKKESAVKAKTRRAVRRAPKVKKVNWQDVCPTCVKYDRADHSPDCDLCRKFEVTEDILCTLNRMDQEDEPHDFQCGAYKPKQPLQ